MMKNPYNEKIWLQLNMQNIRQELVVIYREYIIQFLLNQI